MKIDKKLGMWDFDNSTELDDLAYYYYCCKIDQNNSKLPSYKPYRAIEWQYKFCIDCGRFNKPYYEQAIKTLRNLKIKKIKIKIDG